MDSLNHEPTPSATASFQTGSQTYEARIAALERRVGKPALELEFLKGALKSAPRPRNGTTSVIVGPAASPLPKDAG
jgi:hypothetical protein